MLCPRCQGKHFVLVGNSLRPCPECGGYGETHCCEGDQAQPETVENNEATERPSGRSNRSEQKELEGRIIPTVP
jgi:hypothetical protein